MAEKNLFVFDSGSRFYLCRECDTHIAPYAVPAFEFHVDDEVNGHLYSDVANVSTGVVEKHDHFTTTTLHCSKCRSSLGWKLIDSTNSKIAPMIADGKFVLSIPQLSWWNGNQLLYAYSHNQITRCSCKRNNCIKRYCVCFSAQNYCRKACTCNECSNTEADSADVNEAKMELEAKNPLAFAPEIVVSTPTSVARHRKGCNCKKSLCLKRYCVCFKGKVGCSEQCQCQGCMNKYGRR